MYRVSVSSSTTVSPFLWSIGSVFPITQPLPFLPPPIWSLTPSLHLSEEVNEGRGHPSSLPLLLLNWLLVTSVDSCRLLSPLLWSTSEQTYCSFVAFLSPQPQACLPRKNKRETLIKSSAKVIVHQSTSLTHIHLNSVPSSDDTLRNKSDRLEQNFWQFKFHSFPNPDNHPNSFLHLGKWAIQTSHINHRQNYWAICHCFRFPGGMTGEGVNVLMYWATIFPITPNPTTPHIPLQPKYGKICVWCWRWAVHPSLPVLCSIGVDRDTVASGRAPTAPGLGREGIADTAKDGKETTAGKWMASPFYTHL